jgi:hypothetical protein
MNNPPRPHILIVSEKWCDCTPFHGETNSAHVLYGSLNTSGLATYEGFHFDEYNYFHPEGNPDKELLELCRLSKPDVLFISWFAIPQSPNNPKLETLYFIKFKLNIPIIVCWWDSVYGINMSIAESLSKFVDHHVVLDSSEAYLKYTQNSSQYLPMHVPNDTKIFRNPGLTRDIGVSFIGSRATRPERLDALDYLQDRRVEILIAGGQREQRLSVYRYADILKRSQLTINFSDTTCEFHQTKGRVYEACLCGALLLESQNTETRKILTPMLDYVEFSDKFDLLEKIKYYLDHKEEASALASSGCRKVTQYYSGVTFWQKILDVSMPCHK